MADTTPLLPESHATLKIGQPCELCIDIAMVCHRDAHMWVLNSQPLGCDIVSRMSQEGHTI